MTTTRVPQARGAARREAILSATLELLLGRGMAAISHRTVAQAAGVPHAAIRYYFQSRESLLVACLTHVEAERCVEAETVIGQAASAASTPPPDEIARLLLSCYFGPRLDDDSLRGAVGWLADSTRESPALAALLTEQRAVIDDQLNRLLIACGHRGAPARLVGAVMDGAVLGAVAEGATAVADLAAATAAQLLTLLPHGSPPPTTTRLANGLLPAP